ncbi:DUF2474 domain-containing protein [Candidimonas sp. SYP-B2681]|uniref:DUF2474 domain-containing protein n=1 Tax=Candidimonas sp. SYP-B2681 TaxID=2497686 RepID=UPI000F8833AE|nr:DUF2474 domain-containing protein [Candidimonas sp. SYP-B2681]RTZ40950.1 DUF2474 domain-containing protein [Candidimonas sp. SYP-B2681]
MPQQPLKPSRLWGRRIAWLVGIWAASIAVLAIAAYLLKLLMNLAGMTTGHS